MIAAATLLDTIPRAAVTGIRPSSTAERRRRALGGRRAAAYDDAGVPQPVVSPSSTRLHVANVLSDWLPRQHELPFAAHTIGIVDGFLVAVRHELSEAAIAHRRLEARDERWDVRSIPGAFVDFAGDRGLLISSVAAPSALALHTFA